MIEFGSVCSGIEAASLAFTPLGWKAAWFSEIDKQASALLAYRYPETPNLGDMTTLPARVRSGEVRAPDVLCGGTPCQSFSLAGLRAGLADARGQLTLSFVELADAIDERRAAAGDEPCVIHWENVPGVLSHKDNPFGCFLAGLAGEDVPLVPSGKRWTNAGVVLGPKRAVAWRTLDAQYFRLAQRRRRVLVVASAREGFDPGNVLLEFEGVRRDSPPSRETREDVTHTLAPCLTGSGRGVSRTGDGRGQDPVVACERGGPDRLEAFGGNNQSGPIDVATARSAHGGPHGRLDFETETFVVQSVALRGRDDGATAELGGDLAHALRASGGGGDKAHVLAPVHAFDARQQNVIQYGDMSGPLDTDGETIGVLAFSCKDYGADAQTELSPTLRAMNHAESHANAGGQVAVCVTGEITHALKADGFDGFDGFDGSEDGTGRGQPIVPAHMAARRLMPVECERLQGMYDDYTLIPTKRGFVADGPRYKQIGNSWAVTKMRWVAARIQAELDRCAAPTHANDNLAALLIAAVA